MTAPTAQQMAEALPTLQRRRSRGSGVELTASALDQRMHQNKQRWPNLVVSRGIGRPASLGATEEVSVFLDLMEPMECTANQATCISGADMDSVHGEHDTEEDPVEELQEKSAPSCTPC